MEKLIGKVVEMIVDPGVEDAKVTLGEVVFVAPFTGCGGPWEEWADVVHAGGR